MQNPEKTKRSCGGCTACCKTHSNGHFEKPAGTWCSKCNIGVGCREYNKRPDECKNFACLWLLGEFPDSFRPDRLKLVCDFWPETILGRTITVVRLWEVSRHALFKPEVRTIIDASLETNYVVVQRELTGSGVYHDTITVPGNFLSAHELELLIKAMQSDEKE